MNIYDDLDLFAAINRRLEFVWEHLGLSKDPEESLPSRLTMIQLCDPRGSFLIWLIITGQYPTFFEIQRFHGRIEVAGLDVAVQEYLVSRSQDSRYRKFIYGVEFVSSKNLQLVDVSNTYTNPFVTGIQRVVREILRVKKGANVSLLMFNANDRIFLEIDYSTFEASEANDAPTAGGSPDRLTKPRRLINFMHTFVTRLDASPRRRMLKRFLFPFARKMKSILSVWDKRSIQHKMMDSETPNRILNLFVLDQTWTLMDIANNDGTIEIYQALVEWEMIRFHVVLYDFIPLFHAWTAGAGTPLLYNKYLRLVLLADRVVTISELVAEQARLVTKAFRLERDSWSSRPSSIRGLNLPSGVKGISAGEFLKKRSSIVVLGSIEPRKNLWQIFDSLEILHRQHIDTETILIGNAGWENDQILGRLNALQNLGVDCSRRSRTSDSELRQIVGSASVVIFVSEAEGFGLPVIEALSLGTRIIVSDIRPLNEWRGDWVTCVPLGNPTMLAEEILKHLEAPVGNSRPPYSKVTWQEWDTALFG